MRERLVKELESRGFELLDTNRWAKPENPKRVVQIGYGGRQWTISVRDAGAIVYRSRVPETGKVPADFLNLLDV